MALKGARGFWLLFVAAFIADQILKQIILGGFRLESACLSIILTYNTGVAFSQLSFLGEWLKYLQLGLIVAVAIYFLRSDLLMRFGAPVGLLLGSGSANVLDRFWHGGVVDYVFWHCGFEFAVFNLADVLINIAVGLVLLLHFKK
jgi:signal peptidase II